MTDGEIVARLQGKLTELVLKLDRAEGRLLSVDIYARHGPLSLEAERLRVQVRLLRGILGEATN